MLSPRALPVFTVLALVPLPALAAGPPVETAPALAARITQLAERHWRRQGITPAPHANDLALFRRVTLDLAGRVPTAEEVAAFASDRSPRRYERAVRRLMRGPEFGWHFATVLDEQVQGAFAGNEAFRGYLRRALRQRKGWDVVFREVMVGPWKDKSIQPAQAFLQRRARDLDQLTTDTARSFFGVDISCARCHDHPLVADWKREHYYGLAAFFVRTTGGRGGVGEKATGEAKFAGKDGKERTAAMMFLSGRRVEEKKGLSRREALVSVALAERRFLARAFVNRAWHYFLGRGIVGPPDQMHSANPASIPELLDHLTDDFLANGHDVPRLVAGIVLSRPYQLDSRWAGKGPLPKAGHFAVARLRPLSPRQFARSLVVALGDGAFRPTEAGLAGLEKQASAMMGDLSPASTPYHGSTREALFLSNAEAFRKKVLGVEGGLAARLAGPRGDEALVRKAFLAVLSRPPAGDELAELAGWVKRHPGGRAAACEDLVWALATSAELRFNH